MTTAARSFAILPIEKYPPSANLVVQIGETASVFSQLHAYHVPLPRIFVVPSDFLLQIAEHNHVERLLNVAVKLRWENRAAVTQMSEDIQDAIRHFAIPEELVRALNVTYTESLEHMFLRIIPSFLQTGIVCEDEEVAVTGEANLVESLLKLWAKLYRLPYWQQRMREWREKIEVPAAFVLQEMSNAEMSGFAFNAQSHQKQLVTVMAQWGVAHAAEPEVFDRFEVDAHTGHLLTEKIAYKDTSARLELDHIHLLPLSETERSKPTLSKKQLFRIVDVFEQLRKKVAPRLEATWSFTKNQPVVTGVRVLPTEVVIAKKKVSSQMKVLVIAGQTEDSKHGLSESDGVGLLRSEDVLWKLHEHPLHLVRTQRTTLIKQAIQHALIQYHQLKPSLPIFFRSLNATTSELATLPFGRELEPIEVNPYLGYRGAIRTLHTTELFDVELEALSETWQKTKQPLVLMLPFVRTVGELALLQKHAAQKLTGVPIEIWMQCNTPENILQIGQYAKLGIAGFSLSLNTIHALMHGISPDDEHIFKLYHFDSSLLYLLLSTVRNHLRWSPAKVVVCMETYSAEVVELCQQLGFWGITVKAGDIQRVREQLEREVAKKNE